MKEVDHGENVNGNKAAGFEDLPKPGTEGVKRKIKVLSFAGGLKPKREQYRKLADFKHSPYKRFGFKPMICMKIVQIVLLVCMILLLLVSLGINSAENVNPFVVLFFYYSLWGMMISLISIILTIMAIYTDKVFLAAFFFVEASIASNILITVLYWSVIWWVLRATVLKALWDEGKHDVYYWLYYY